MAFVIEPIINAYERAPNIMLALTGGAIFLISYAIAIRITPPPNDNLNYLLFGSKYIDAATPRANNKQLDDDLHWKDKNAFQRWWLMQGKEVPALVKDPSDGVLKYWINGNYVLPSDALKALTERNIPDSWGTDVKFNGLALELNRLHLDDKGQAIAAADVPKATNASTYNNPLKAEATKNQSSVLSVAGKAFLEEHRAEVRQAYPTKTDDQLTDDDLEHIYNILAGGRADRRKTDAGENTRVNLAKWAVLRSMTNQSKDLAGEYLQTRQKNSLAWARSDRGKATDTSFTTTVGGRPNSVGVSNKK